MSSPIALSVFLSLAKDKKQFDKITVRRVDNNFVVKYYDADSKSNYNLTLTNTSLGEYVKTLCQLFQTDNYPFADVQFNFLGFPTFLANQETFKQNSNLVNTLTTAANIVSESVFADYPEGVYCEDDEMPPLIPQNNYIGRAARTETDWDRHY